MNKYIKPTISLVSNGGIATASASSCSSSTADAQLVESILNGMGYTDVSAAFGTHEQCEIPVDIEGYCKFSSAIQVFFS